MRRSLLFQFAIIGVLFCLVIGENIISASYMVSQGLDVRETTTQLNYLEQSFLLSALVSERIQQQQASSSSDPPLDQLLSAITESLQTVQESPLTKNNPDFAHLVSDISPRFERYVDSASLLIEAPDRAPEVAFVLQEEFSPLLSGLQEMQEMNAGRAHQLVNQSIYDVSIRTTLLLFVIGLGLWRLLSLLYRIRLVEQGAIAFGNGHLNTPITVNGRDEVGRIADALNVMAENLVTRFKAVTEITEALHQSEERFRELVTNLQVGILLFGKEGEVLLWNRAALELLNITEEDVAEQKSIESDQATSEDGIPFSVSPLKEVFKQKKALNNVVMGVKTDSNVNWMLVNATPQLAADGTVQQVICSVSDITERKQTQAALAQSEEDARQLALLKEAAESANRAKSEFLANMSHELRTPLNGILGYAQILRKEKNLSPKQANGLDIIQRSGEHLLTLINDILDISKIEARKMELQPTTFDLCEMLENIAHIFAIHAQQKGIEFHYEFLAGGCHIVQADEKRVRQVLINLLGNAVKFTSKGHVTFRVKTLGTRGAKNKGTRLLKIRFEVEDTGSGIASDALSLIFEPFRQVGKSSQMSGTGLGLAISSQLVKLMNSTLQVKSKVGQGSLFWMTLELPEVVNALAKGADRQRSPIGFRRKGCHVLIVDDNQENRSVLTALLAPLGFSIEEAADGEEALFKVKASKPDVILMDLRMPKMDGFEAIRQIRALSFAHEIIIITISASAFDYERQKSLQWGSDDFIAKPYDLNELLQKLADHLGLEWIYEKENQPNQPSLSHESADAFVVPPQASLAALLDLAKRGNIRAIIKQSNLLIEQNADYTPFANELYKLAKSFKMKQIQQFIEQEMR